MAETEGEERCGVRLTRAIGFLGGDVGLRRAVRPPRIDVDLTGTIGSHSIGVAVRGAMGPHSGHGSRGGENEGGCDDRNLHIDSLLVWYALNRDEISYQEVVMVHLFCACVSRNLSSAKAGRPYTSPQLPILSRALS
jgi:hypothetical protein